MRELHDSDRNHVWAYYIRNMIRPAVIAEEKVDLIIGNPPWLTYGQSADIIREELRGMSEKRYQIWAGGKLAPHQDIATLFYTRCAELYAQVNAVIGMVMPHSALRAGQHLKWRGGNYRQKSGGRNAPRLGLDFQVHEPWDLDNVVPDFFPMPASVVFARYMGAERGTALAPGTVQAWRGDWQQDYDGISRNSEALHHDDGTFKSPYAALSSQGPTIVDRRLFFVETMPNTTRLPAANTTKVQPRRSSQDKVLYEGQLHQLEGVVHTDHLFDVYLGECVAPYVSLEPLKAVLPVHRPTMTMAVNHDDCEETSSGWVKHDACSLEVAELHPSMQRRWNIADEMFRQAHKDQAIKDLFSNLNHLNKLADQLEYLQRAVVGDEAIRVAYTSSGRPTAAIIRDDHAIVDYVLFQTVCDSVGEANYLITVINSGALASAAEAFMARGLFGARHFQKQGWKLPIPRYDEYDDLHVRLSELGAAAEQECRALVRQSDIESKPAGDAQSRAARRLLRHQWQPTSTTAQAIEKAVAELLSSQVQAALAARQMQSA